MSSLAYANDLEDTLLTKSRTVAKELLTTLKKQLTTALENQDTEKAVVVCSSIGQSIATNLSEKNALLVKRVSLKNRNPNGKPDEYESKVLTLFDEMNSKKELKPDFESFETVKESDGLYFRYMKPIVTGNSCLQCHGNPEAIKPEVKKALADKYPNDLAFGYKEGDIRGAVSLKIKL